MLFAHQAAVGRAIGFGNCSFIDNEPLNILIRIYCLRSGLIAYSLFTMCSLQHCAHLHTALPVTGTLA